MYEGQIVPKKVDTFGLFVADIVTDEQKKGILERSWSKAFFTHSAESLFWCVIKTKTPNLKAQKPDTILVQHEWKSARRQVVLALGSVWLLLSYPGLRLSQEYIVTNVTMLASEVRRHVKGWGLSFSPLLPATLWAPSRRTTTRSGSSRGTSWCRSIATVWTSPSPSWSSPTSTWWSRSASGAAAGRETPSLPPAVSGLSVCAGDQKQWFIIGIPAGPRGRRKELRTVRSRHTSVGL